MKQILFVDDEPMILEALERTMSVMSREWTMRFAGSGTEALKLLEEKPADAVVSDMRMPYMNGAQLLHEVMLRHPQTIRLILSGFSDAEVIMKCIGGTHQFIAKPCSGETLRGILCRALGMQHWIQNEKLRALVTRISSIPSAPSLYFEITREVESGNGSLERVGQIIAKDPAMTAKILHLVNSAFFGLHRQLSDPTEAVMQLGYETIRSLVLAIHVFSEMKTSGKAMAEIQKLWNHSMATATRAKTLARTEKMDKELVETSFTGGLLHDIGRLVLWANLPREYEDAIRLANDEKLPLVETEETIFGTNHASLGGYILGLWGLPAALVESVVFHHFPSKVTGRSLSPLAIVHLSNVLELQSGQFATDPVPPTLDQTYLTELGIWERACAWQKIASTAAKSAEADEKNPVCR